MAPHRWPRCGLWLLALCGIVFARAAEAGVPSLYLIQNSGWMEPFYTDQNSLFKPLLRQLVEASHTERVIVAGFNQDGQVPGHPSPEVAYDGPYAQAAVDSAVNGITMPSRDRGRLADADFNGALSKSLNVILDAKSSIVWLVTNNKNSPGNSPEIVRNTRDFAEALRNSPFLPYVVAYPVEMRVTGRLYTETGLIIYAIAYGDEAADALRDMVAAPPLRGLFTDPPVKLKHLDQAPLAFTPAGASATGGAPGAAPVVADVSADGRAVLELHGSLRSEYYPQVIDGADLSIAWQQLDGVADAASLPVTVLAGPARAAWPECQPGRCHARPAHPAAGASGRAAGPVRAAQGLEWPAAADPVEHVAVPAGCLPGPHEQNRRAGSAFRTCSGTTTRSPLRRPSSRSRSSYAIPPHR